MITSIGSIGRYDTCRVILLPEIVPVSGCAGPLSSEARLQSAKSTYFPTRVGRYRGVRVRWDTETFRARYPLSTVSRLFREIFPIETGFASARVPIRETRINKNLPLLSKISTYLDIIRYIILIHYQYPHKLDGWFPVSGRNRSRW